MLLSKLSILGCFVAALTIGISSTVPLTIVNNGDLDLDVFWVDQNNDMIKQTPVPLERNASLSLQSYDKHKFVVACSNCQHNPPTNVQFTKMPKPETLSVIFNKQSNSLEVLDNSINSYKILRDSGDGNLMKKIEEAAKLCTELRNDKSAYSKCVADSVYDDVSRITDSLSTMTKYRDSMSNRLRNYTCADDNLPSSPAISSRFMTVAGKDYKIDNLFNSSHAKIWKVDNFITPEECAVLESHGKARLKRATVAAEDGSSVISNHRKAQQAAYNLHHQNPDSDPLWPLFQRILSVTNRHGGYNLVADGQEDFTIIQYNVDDQYMPHCDGTCDGTVLNPGGRIATSVLYCNVAPRGGGTSFSKADVFVKPVNGMAAFFTYLGPDGRMDSGMTEHSGCPVLQGEKWITAVWMRQGVTKEEPWTLFDPSGVRMMQGGANEQPEDQQQEESEDQVRDGGSSSEVPAVEPESCLSEQ